MRWKLSESNIVLCTIGANEEVAINPLLYNPVHSSPVVLAMWILCLLDKNDVLNKIGPLSIVIAMGDISSSAPVSGAGAY